MPYDERTIAPMREEVTRLGARELKSGGEVDAFLAGPGTRLVFINSVCGCAAGQARPGLTRALENGGARPEGLATVFAGQDMEATERVRAHIPGQPPSSPSAALFRDGELLWFMPRKEFVHREAEEIAGEIGDALRRHRVLEAR